MKLGLMLKTRIRMISAMKTMLEDFVQSLSTSGRMQTETHLSYQMKDLRHFATEECGI